MGVALGAVPDANRRAATSRRIFRPHEAARFWYNTRRSVEGGVGWRGGSGGGRGGPRRIDRSRTESGV